MTYSVNPVLEFTSQSDGDYQVFDYYRRVYHSLAFEDVALLTYAQWPLSILGILNASEDIYDASEIDRAERINDLIDRGIIVASNGPLFTLASYWIEHGWQSSLLYHLASQEISHTDDDCCSEEEKRLLCKEFYSPEDIRYFREGCEYHLASNVRIQLRRDLVETGERLDEVLERRTSFAPYTGKCLTIPDLSHILWASNCENYLNRKKVHAEIMERPELATSSLWIALELYIYLRNPPNGINQGLYHLNLSDFTLDFVMEGNFDDEIISFSAGQERAVGGSACVFITGNYERIRRRYRHERAYRALMVQVGEMAQNILMNATYLGFSYFISPAINDPQASDFLGLEEDFHHLYLIGIG